MASEQTFTFCGTVVAIRDKSIGMRPEDYPHNDRLVRWIPRSVIVDSDSDLDEIETNMELTVELPAWFAKREGLA